MKVIFLVIVALFLTAEVYLAPPLSNEVDVKELRKWPEPYEGNEPRLITVADKSNDCEGNKALRRAYNHPKTATLIINGCQNEQYWRDVGIARCIDRQYFMLDKLAKMCLTIPEVKKAMLSGFEYVDDDSDEPIGIDMIKVYENLGHFDVRPVPK